jgi:uncharacterized protein (DUF2147 family)
LETELKKTAVAFVLATASLLAMAQSTPVGLWKTIDDETHTEKSYVRITDAGGGHLTGKVEKIIDPAKANATCTACPDDDQKGKPIVGLTLFKDAKPDADEAGLWGDTQILKPEDGKHYKLKMRMIDGGKKLQVRGYLGPFYKTQEWIRIE